MWRRFWSRLDDLPFAVYLIAIIAVGLLGLAAIVAPGVAGWYAGDRLFAQGGWGAIVPYVVAGFLWGFTDRRVVRGYRDALVAFVLLVPTIYVLLLVVRATLVLTGLARYGAHRFFASGIAAVLVGCALMILFTLKGMFAKVADEGRAFDAKEFFLLGMALRVPFALAIAMYASLPAGAAGRIVVGLFWGVVAAVCGMLHNALAYRDSISGALIHVVVTEVLLGFVLLFAVLDAVTEHEGLAAPLQTIPAAAVACILTYLVARAGARLHHAW